MVYGLFQVLKSFEAVPSPGCWIFWRMWHLRRRLRVSIHVLRFPALLLMEQNHVYAEAPRCLPLKLKLVVELVVIQEWLTAF
jgi:hypothetical protein